MTVSFATYATYAALIISFVSLIYTVYHNKKVGQKTNEALSYSRESNKISDKAINIAKDSLNINIINERAKNYKNFNNIFHEFKNKSTLSFNSNIADLQDLMRKNTMEINNIFLVFPEYKKIYKNIKHKIIEIIDLESKIKDLYVYVKFYKFLDKPDELDKEIQDVRKDLDAPDKKVPSGMKKGNEIYLKALEKIKKDDSFVREEINERNACLQKKTNLEKETKSEFDEMYANMEKLSTYTNNNT